MPYTIKQEKNKVTINVNDIEGKQDKLLENFNKCKDGSCECPTNEYSKLEGLDIASEPDKITVIITTKENEEVNEQDIAKCLDYSISKAEE